MAGPLHLCATARAALLLATLLAATCAAGAAEPPPTPAVLAPGWAPLAYPAPVPGTYELPPLGNAADGDVLDTAGQHRRVHDFLGDKVVVMGFVYRACPDVNGCPLANYVFTGIQKRVLDDPALRGAARLVSMSFDPTRDTPDILRRHAANLTVEGGDWQFLTTASQDELAPILRAYGQAVVNEVGADGKPLGTIAHVLRVFLIDQDRRIRNIYSSAFLHADTVTSDIRTLLQERVQQGTAAAPVTPAPVPRAGDDKDGYEHADYETRSRSLTAPLGVSADLLALARAGQLGLPPVPMPDGSPMTAAQVALGRKLFFDRRLSRNNTFSCAMCHVPDQGFTSNEIATAVGIEGRTVRRNSPTIYNAVYAELLFHDGRETRLSQQVWGPLLAANEMGNPSVGYVLDKIRALADYDGLFEASFGRGPTMETLGAALAAYEATLISGDSPFDRWHFGKDDAALSAQAVRGFRLFTGKAACAGCHTIGTDSALFTDHTLHNTGIGYRRTMAPPPAARRVQIAPGTFVTIDPAVVAEASEPVPSDLGRYEVTEHPDDRWKYKTPGLRNVALTAPYMHDGSIATLREVVEFYDQGGVPNELLDPRIRPLGLSDGDKQDLVAFLESLTGSTVGAIVADAMAAPIGDPE